MWVNTQAQGASTYRGTGGPSFSSRSPVSSWSLKIEISYNYKATEQWESLIIFSRWAESQGWAKKKQQKKLQHSLLLILPPDNKENNENARIKAYENSWI